MLITRINPEVLAEVAEACQVDPGLVEDIYPCTPLQIEMMADPNSYAYKYCTVFSFRPSVQVDRVCAAFRCLVALNPILRTKFVDCRVGIVQVVLRELECISYTTTHRASFEQVLEREYSVPMNFETRLHRMIVVDDEKLIFVTHHAIFDAWTTQSIFTDLARIYHGQEPVLHPEYKLFVEYCLSVNDESAKSFWASRFTGHSAIFPAPKAGHILDAARSLKTRITVGAAKQESLASTLPSYLEAAWAVTSSLYSSSQSTSFGLVLSGRHASLGNVQHTMGPTVVTIPVQVHVDPGATIASLVAKQSALRRAVQTNPALHYGSAKIRQASKEAGIAMRFTTVLNFLRDGVSTVSPPDHILQLDCRYNVRKPYCLVLVFSLDDGGASVEAEFDDAIIPESQMKRILQQFKHVVGLLLQSPPDTLLGQLQMLTMQDRRELRRWNHVNAASPSAPQGCLDELVGQRAISIPDQTAVQGHDGVFTYRELETLSRAVAGELSRRGVGSGDVVGLVFEKSAWAVVAHLAVLMSGAMCLPVDPGYPLSHKRTVMEKTRARLLLASAAQLDSVEDLGVDTMTIGPDQTWETHAPGDQGSYRESSPSQPAYILFTSGSTGTPKGIVIEHRNLVCTLIAFGTRLQWQPGSRVLQFASYVWDASILEIFGTLLAGGCVCVPSDEQRMTALAEFIESNSVECAILTPTVIRTLSPDEVPHLRSLVSAGEAVDVTSVELWRDQVRFFNGWGPSESAVCSALAEVTESSPDLESIGTPSGNALWIVDDSNVESLVPIGVVGEILVDGPGVARGYLGDEARTAACFIEAPSWAPPPKIDTDASPRRMYRTGDLARYNPDGTIRYVGRRDDQVKIRGQRLRLGQVERMLASCDAVRNAFATLVTEETASGPQHSLVAVVSLADTQLPRGSPLGEMPDSLQKPVTRHLHEIRNALASKLPSYAVPTIWLAVEDLPLTPSTKLDRSSIKQWLASKSDLTHARLGEDLEANTQLTPPSSAAEIALCTAWSQVLAIPQDQVGLESSFSRLGGDSISAMKIASNCRQLGVHLSVIDLMQAKDLAAAAAASHPILGNPNGSAPASAPLPFTKLPNLSALSKTLPYMRKHNIEAVIPASSSQAFSLSVAAMVEDSARLYFALRSSQGFDTNELVDACRALVHHHAILRTVFVREGASLYQVVLRSPPANTVAIAVQDQDVKVKDSHSPTTTLAATPLCFFRLRLAADDESICKELRIHINHAQYDGVSTHLLLRDLQDLYMGKTLVQGPSFHDWVSHIASLDNEESLRYWRDVLRGSTVTRLSAPGVMQRLRTPIETTFFQVNVPDARRMEATCSDVVRAAWALTWSCLTGSQDVVFGSAVANRNLPFPEVDRVPGPCVNTIPVRVQLFSDGGDKEMTLGALLRQIHERALGSALHHHVEMQSIVENCTDWPSSARPDSLLVYSSNQA
ncbi:hypothetical protein B0I35DRAFT_353657, partial [Stachybotrys elegans]